MHCAGLRLVKLMCEQWHQVWVWIQLKSKLTCVCVLNSGSCTLFTEPASTEFGKIDFKTGSHSTIHTFKNYFATVFSVFSNKRCPNRPLVFKSRMHEVKFHFEILKESCCFQPFMLSYGWYISWGPKITRWIFNLSHGIWVDSCNFTLKTENLLHWYVECHITCLIYSADERHKIFLFRYLYNNIIFFANYSLILPIKDHTAIHFQHHLMSFESQHRLTATLRHSQICIAFFPHKWQIWLGFLQGRALETSAAGGTKRQHPWTPHQTQ